MNRWNIPPELEREVLARDIACIYCGIKFGDPGSARSDKPSWEHIVNDARVITRQNIARCCIACNSSKGARDLRLWLSSTYCQRRGITGSTVSSVVQEALLDMASKP
jgi:hypothetical protein